jgi:hypothetical protein
VNRNEKLSYEEYLNLFLITALLFAIGGIIFAVTKEIALLFLSIIAGSLIDILRFLASFVKSYSLGNHNEKE